MDKKITIEDDLLYKTVKPYIDHERVKFKQLWQESGLPGDIISERSHQLNEVIDDTLQIVRETFKKCYQDEVTLRDRMIHQIENYKKKIDDLSRRLKINGTALIKSQISENLKIFDKHGAYRKVLRHIEDIKNERLDELDALKQEEDNLCELLDEDSYQVADDSIIHEIDLENVRNHIISLGKEKDLRIEFIKNSQKQVLDTQEELEFNLPDNSSLKQIINLDDVEVRIDKEFINQIRNSLNKMQKYRETLKASIEDLKIKINDLWIKFDLSNQELYHTIKINTNTYNNTILKKLQEEYERCLNFKHENMNKLVNKMRDDINKYWNKMYFSDTQRNKFQEYNNARVIDDNIFDIHERYLKKLEDNYFSNEQIYSLLNQWNDKWSQYMAFEREYSDPNRFKLRSYSALTEQKERSKFEKELPRIEAKILKLTGEIDDEILINDMKIVDYFAQEKAYFMLTKEELKRERQIRKEHETKVSTPKNHKISSIQHKTNSGSRQTFAQSPNVLSLKRLAPSSPLAAPKSDSKSSLVAKRNLFASSGNRNFSTNSLIRRPLVANPLNNLDKPTQTNNTKRRSIKSLAEKFKRRSKRVYNVNNLKENSSNGCSVSSASSNDNNDLNFNMNHVNSKCSTLI